MEDLLKPANTQIRLTQYSHGAGCGCKLSPKVLSDILRDFKASLEIPGQKIRERGLLVGTETGDDAAVYQVNLEQAIISTTDFFMPIVDDPFLFGRIAATNAMSDVYAMGGRPLLAISILGWPIDKLPAGIAAKVIQGAQAAASEAGILIAGGHSIDSPEPIFGLAVTGQVHPKALVTNAGAKEGDLLYLTKPLGIGILSTAQKQKKLSPEDAQKAHGSMCRLNDVGGLLAEEGLLAAMTDVTGFGLAGHLLEVCEASKASAEIDLAALPLFDNIFYYMKQNCIPGGSKRNFSSYGHKLPAELGEKERLILCDPQTSGGLLLAVSPENKDKVESLLKSRGLAGRPIGRISPALPSGRPVLTTKGALAETP